jgi:hypothetical protein
MKCVCCYLYSPIGFVEIHDNATGCNSLKEVASACGITGVEQVTSSQHSVVCYPDPAGDQVRFKLEIAQNQKVTFRLHDIQGKLLNTRVNDRWNHSDGEFIYDTRALPEGLYLFSLTTDQPLRSFTGKFVVKH